MWQILEHKRLDRRFKSLPIDILKRYEKWKDIISISGPESLDSFEGFEMMICAENGRDTCLLD